MDSAPGLNGLTVGIPAARRATETARLVERWGGTPLVGPTVREVTASDPSPVLDATRRIIDSELRWSVHLTGVGTRRWFALAEQGGLRDELLDTLRGAGVIPRGQKAKSALAEVDIRPAWIPEGETSDEIAEWLAPQLTGTETVAVQVHGEPVPELAAAITATGADLIEVQSYTWDLPEDLGPAQELIRALLDGSVHALTVTSAPQVKFLDEIAKGMGLAEQLVDALRDRVFLAAVGVVAAEGLENLGLKADLIAQPPRMGALVRALAAAREQIIAKAGADHSL
jgi:uroporphyrinogen-III synthase